MSIAARVSKVEWFIKHRKGRLFILSVESGIVREITPDSKIDGIGEAVDVVIERIRKRYGDQTRIFLIH